MYIVYYIPCVLLYTVAVNSSLLTYEVPGTRTYTFLYCTACTYIYKYLLIYEQMHSVTQGEEKKWEPYTALV